MEIREKQIEDILVSSPALMQKTFGLDEEPRLIGPDYRTVRQIRHAEMYSNYAIDLGLLAKNDTSVYLTPEGFKFVIQMQLHKSLKLMNYLNIN